MFEYYSNRRVVFVDACLLRYVCSAFERIFYLDIWCVINVYVTIIIIIL